MASSADHSQILAEKLIAGVIRSTWLLWLVGGLYIVGPALGWILAFIAAYSLYVRVSDAPNNAVIMNWPLWSWAAGMLAMLVILWIGHANFQLGTGQTLKSTIGWAKGWALIALFPVACAILQIRIETIARAVCQLGGQTLIVLPVFLIAPFLGLPAELWVSPLKVIGGSGPEYFSATLYTIEPGAGTPRWQFFAPWSPAAGMVAVIHIVLALQEKSSGWRSVGILAGVLIAVLSQSRLALLAILIVLPLIWSLKHAKKPVVWLIASPMPLILGIFGLPLAEWAEQLIGDIKGARADSTRVRETLARIAVERWQNEAPWFGHGIVENGPHLVEYMPIGSHHSWYGLLFVKGALGALALAVPLGLTLIALLLKAASAPVYRCGFGLVCIMVLYSFGENLEMLAYLTWPAWAAIGIALSSAEKRQLG